MHIKALDEEAIGLRTTLTGSAAAQEPMGALSERVGALEGNVELDGTQVDAWRAH